MKFHLTSLAFILVVVVLVPFTLSAGDYEQGMTASVADRGFESNFEAMKWEFKTELGSFHMYEKRKFQPTQLDYVMANALFGLMLYDPNGPWIFRGNTELFMGLTGGGYANGPGTWIAPGVILAIQYNFVPEESRWIPFVGFNGGFVFVDSALKHVYVGSEFNFSWGSYLGIRCFLDDNWSIQATANYNHMSNGNITSDNHGIDALGGMIGVSYYFN